MGEEQCRDQLLEMLEDSPEGSVVLAEADAASEIKEDIVSLMDREKLQSLAISNKLKFEELESRKQDRRQRETFSNKIFKLLCFFLIIVGCIIFLSTLHIPPLMKYVHFRLSDNVVIALLTTSSANVIGIFIFVVKYLFNVPVKRNNNESQEG